MTPREQFLAGVRAELPILLGVAPFGLIFGAIAMAAGLPATLAQAMSSVIFAGSAQFIAAELIAVGTPALVLLTTTLIVNLRHLLYSASLAPHVRALPLRWKMLLAYLLTDEAYAVTIIHYTESDSPPATRHWFFLGAGLALWSVWQTSTALGIILGAAIPASWSLDFALALTFTGIVVPTLRDRPHVGAALSAGLVAVLAAAWPFKLGLMAAALTGIVVGVVLEGWQRQTTAKVIHDEDTA
ncbi:AzlC family protein [Candidatus Promineifilum breve]|uniref:AzlC family protein n=1 Tax=Candidatus Promineifilum breve TaxID=1806508 RepID=A0A160SZV3_9CHLR|nr:AzlC family ABC transporter permease [Candidatus Promineifilum breve]CUS01938.1 AzlC family protein [Candidatus Promineifilum breve]